MITNKNVRNSVFIIRIGYAHWVVSGNLKYNSSGNTVGLEAWRTAGPIGHSIPLPVLWDYHGSQSRSWYFRGTKAVVVTVPIEFPRDFTALLPCKTLFLILAINSGSVHQPIELHWQPLCNQSAGSPCIKWPVSKLCWTTITCSTHKHHSTLVTECFKIFVIQGSMGRSTN